MKPFVMAEFFKNSTSNERLGIGKKPVKDLSPYAKHRVVVFQVSDETVVRQTGMSIEGALMLYVKSRQLERPHFVRIDGIIYEVNDFRDYGLEKSMLIKLRDITF